MNWNKISAVGTVLCLLVAIAALAIQVTRPDVSAWVGLLLLLTALFGVAAFFSVRFWNNFERVRSLPFRLLVTDCDFLLREYKKLAFDHPNDVRTPIAAGALPEYNDHWYRQHVQMAQLRLCLFGFLFKADKLAEEKRWGYKPSSLLVNENTLTMVDLIAGLENLRKRLIDNQKDYF